MVKVWRAVLIVSLAFLSIGAATAQDPTSCGTDASTAAIVETLHQANVRESGRLHALAALGAERRNGMFVAPRSPAFALLDHPSDLEKKTLRFTPSGERYALHVEPLEYDNEIGTLARTFSVTNAADWFYVKADLPSLRLPLFGKSVGTLYLTAFNSIALSPPRSTSVRQYDALEAALTPEATIAPLMMTDSRPYGLNPPAVWLRETADFVLVTWRATGSVFSYDVQAKIAKDGEITFSYRSLGNTTWGAVLISPGASAWTTETTAVTLDDPAGDVAPAIPAAMRSTLDLRSLTVKRMAATGAYVISVRVGATIGSALPRRGDSAQLAIRFGDAPPMTITLGWNTSGSLAQPGRTLPSSAAFHVTGNELQLMFFRNTLGSISSPAHVVVTTSLLSISGEADQLTGDIDLPDGPVPGTDLGAADGAELSLPIVEAFTLPTIDLEAVWESVRTAGSLSDDEIDGVAIFQNFFNDIDLFAGAFASGGNPQADGVSMYVGKGTAFPRSPTLMHMNVVNYSNNQDINIAGRNLLHEFGHRWLQFVETMENGTRTIALNPQPAHPPQFASTPAAFPVMSAQDTSTMGGGWFTQSGSSFTSASWSAYGLSWLDLYLMGLAAPEEVPSTYVIDGSNPPLGLAYTPPSNITVTGTRHDLTLQQVVEAMGPRVPAFGATQRDFRLVFVLVAADPLTAAADLALVDTYRRAFEENFAKATGGRAVIQTLFWPKEPRRRSAHS